MVHTGWCTACTVKEMRDKTTKNDPHMHCTPKYLYFYVLTISDMPGPRSSHWLSTCASRVLINEELALASSWVSEMKVTQSWHTSLPVCGQKKITNQLANIQDVRSYAPFGNIHLESPRLFFVIKTYRCVTVTCLGVSLVVFSWG